MVLPLLATLPAIFTAIAGAADLFDRGREVYQAVTGQPSAVGTPAELQGQVAALPQAQAEAWAAQMAQQVEAYRAETDRLKLEQGELTPEMLAALPPAVAGEVVRLRATTRPIVVLRMTHVMLVPVYVIVIDASVTYFNAVARLFGTAVTLPLLAPVLFVDGVYRDLYEGVVPYATVIVVAYMLLRELGKESGKPGDGDIGDLVGRIGGMFGSIGKLFRRKPPAS